MIPAFRARCIPAGFVARPLRERYPGGGAEGFGEEGLAQTCGFIARRATKRRPLQGSGAPVVPCGEGARDKLRRRLRQRVRGPWLAGGGPGGGAAAAGGGT